MDKLILAVIGLPGSGKTEVINYLTQKLQCPKVYFGQPTFDELKKRGMEVNEANERKIREELRQKHGMAAFAILCLPKIKEHLLNHDIVLAESLYSWEEYLTLEKEYGDQVKLLAVYASPQTRHARLKNRPLRPFTEEEATSRDHAQIVNLDQARPIVLADYTVINERGLEELQQQVEDIIKILNQ